MSAPLAGRRALVTGATSDIGVAVVRSLLEDGAEVHAVGRRPERLEAIAHPELHFHALDLADRGVGAQLAALGPLDVVVLNAAHPPEMAPLLTVGVEALRAVLDLNFFGALECCVAALPGMVERRFGRIVHVSSVAASIGQANGPGYCASKAALDALLRNVAVDYSPAGVTANSLEVGPVLTERWKAYGPVKARRMALGTAVRRIGQPEDVANAVRFLISDQASFITGETLRVDGGLHLGNPMSVMYVREGQEGER